MDTTDSEDTRAVQRETSSDGRGEDIPSTDNSLINGEPELTCKARLETFRCTVYDLLLDDLWFVPLVIRDLELVVVPLREEIQKGYILKFGIVYELNKEDREPKNWYGSIEVYLLWWKKIQEPISKTQHFYNIEDDNIYNYILSKDNDRFKTFVRCEEVLDPEKSIEDDFITFEVHIDTNSLNNESELEYIPEIQEEVDEARTEATFQFIVKNVSKMKDSLLSPAQYVCNLPFKVKVMTSQDRPPQDKPWKIPRSFGYYLQCNRESESISWSCYAYAELRLLSWKEGQEPFTKIFHHVFHNEEDECGDLHFMPLQDVLDPEKGYIKDDSIKLEVFVEADPFGDIYDDVLIDVNNNVLYDF